MFKAYNISFSKIKPNSTIEVLSEPVFYNENIKIGNKVIKHTKWIENGVYCIAIFLGDNGQFFTIAEFNARFGLTVDFLTFSGCICSMKQYIKKLNINDNNACDMNVALSKISSVRKGIKLYYSILTNDDRFPNCCSKWSEKCNQKTSWKHVFLKINKIRDVKLRWLAMRILHRMIATNITLGGKKGDVDDTRCNFCNNKRDSIEHIFWRWYCVRRFWNRLDVDVLS